MSSGSQPIAKRNSGKPACLAVQDAKDQRLVLAFLLETYPSQLTIPAVAQALNTDPGGFPSDDAVERAIRDLVGGGLLSCHGRFVRPTRAALYLSRLGMEL